MWAFSDLRCTPECDLQRCDSAHSVVTFCRIWVLKELCRKATHNGTVYLRIAEPYLVIDAAVFGDPTNRTEIWRSWTYPTSH
jgi:hypothetical protein